MTRSKKQNDPASETEDDERKSEEIANAMHKLYKSIKFQADKKGFHKKEFDAWCNNHKKEAKILHEKKNLCFEEIGNIMYEFGKIDNKYQDINYKENKNRELWLDVLKDRINKSNPSPAKSSKNESFTNLTTQLKRGLEKIESSKTSIAASDSSSDSSSESSSDSSSSESESSSSSSSSSISESCSDEEKESKKKSKKKKKKSDILTLLAEAMTRAGQGSIAIDILKNDKQDPKEWFDYFDRCAVGNGWNEKIKGEKVPQFFKGEAEQIWKSMKKSKRYKYSSIKKKLIKKLQPEDKALEATHKFFNCTQGEEEPVEDFARRLKRLAKQSGKIDDKDIIGQMRKSMRKEIALATITVQTKSRKKFIKQCKAAEKCLKNKENESINAITRKTFNMSINEKGPENRNYGTNKQKSVTDSHQGTSHQNVPHTQAQSTQGQKETLKCFVCQSPVHLKRECPVWLKRKAYRESLRCTKCNRTGHTVEYCRSN